jgi:predicted dehydrogenase
MGEQATSAWGLKANIGSHYGDAEDNAVLTVRFPKGIAILEATWTTWHTGAPVGPIVYGTRGTLVVDHVPDPSTGKAAQAVKVYATRGYAGEPDRVVFGEPLPKGRASIAEEMVHHLESGEPLHPTLEIGHNLETMAILDAGIRSAASGRVEQVDDAVWSIG